MSTTRPVTRGRFPIERQTSAIKRDIKYVEEQIDDIAKEIVATNKIIASIQGELIRQNDLRQMIKINKPTSTKRYLRENKTVRNMLEKTLAVSKKDMESMILQRAQLMSDVLTYTDELWNLKESEKHARTNPSVPSKLPPRSPKIIPTPPKALPMQPPVVPVTSTADLAKKQKFARNRRRGKKRKE